MGLKLDMNFMHRASQPPPHSGYVDDIGSGSSLRLPLSIACAEHGDVSYYCVEFARSNALAPEHLSRLPIPVC